MDPVSNPIPAAQPIAPTPEPVGTPPPPTLEDEPTSKRLKLIILGVVVLLLAIGIPAGVMVFGKKAPEPVQKIVVATPTPTPDPTANWKTYMNLSYGYEIKLPPDWNAYSSDPNIYDKCEENSINNVRVELARTKLKECAGLDSAMSANTEISIIYSETENNITKETFTEAKEIVFAGEKALKDAFTERSELPRDQATIIWVDHNGKGYMISLRQTDKVGIYDKVYDQILSTFKFLDASQTGNIFQVPELGIKITVPDSLNDLTYTYDSKVGAAYFSTKKLEAGGSFCTSKNGPIGLIAKDTTSPEGLASGPQKENIKKLGSFYYSFLQPQATCSDDKSVQTMQTSQVSALQQSFQTVELSQ